MFAIALTLLTPVHAEDALTPDESSTTQYELDARDSRLYVLVRYDRNALVAGHDHVIAATDFDGRVTWDPADPSSCDVRIDFPVDALSVDPGNARRWEDLEGTTSDGDKKSIEKNYEGKHQLQADLFPRIVFASTACERSGSSYKVSGTLDIHGVSAPVNALMQIEADGESFSAEGSFTASHGTWSMDPFTALFGSVKNDDTLKFVIDVTGHAAD